MARERKVNVGVIVVVVRDDGRFLMCRRSGMHGAGTWSTPGGWMRHKETPEQTAEREVLEETGVTVRRPELFAVTNDVFTEEDVHSVTLWLAARYWSGEPTIREPNKCTELRWVAVDEMPRPLFLPFENINMRVVAEQIGVTVPL